MKLNHSIKYDDNYNIIEFIEKDSDDVILRLETYDPITKVKFIETPINYIYTKHDKYGNNIFIYNSYGTFTIYIYHPPVILLDGSIYHWNKATITNTDTLFYDFFGRLTLVETESGMIEKRIYDNCGSYIELSKYRLPQTYGDNPISFYTDKIPMEMYDEAMKEYTEEYSNEFIREYIKPINIDLFND